VDSVGLRYIIPKDEVPRIYAVLKKKKNGLFDNQTWNRRYKEYMDKLKTGSLYDVACPMFNMARPAGEWNSYDISVQERRVVVHVNGWKVLDTDLARMTMPIGKFPIAFAELPLEGMIALQDHGGEAWFRNIWIRPL